MTLATQLARSLSVLLLVVAAVPTAAQDATRLPTAVTLFGGRMTDKNFDEVLTLNDVGWRDANLVGVAASRRLWEIGRFADIEAEGQIVRHFGNQNHWELNALGVGRWRLFPWSETVHTTLAYGLGFSYATELPAAEVALNGTSKRFLFYWVGELEVGPPDAPWSAIARLHHRSTGFGLLSDNGGSDFLVAGLRWRF
ncbi:MAG TPA: hypothetical protein VD978_07190 [Azospirillum sp.]|nr:hypothetical protein [Azospirillum sp.]